MNTKHWLFASAVAISLHLMLAYSVVYLNLDDQETIKQAFTGEGISVNLASYALPAVTSIEVTDIPKEQTIVETNKEMLKKPVKEEAITTAKPTINKTTPKIKTIKPSVETDNKPSKNSVVASHSIKETKTKENTQLLEESSNLSSPTKPLQIVKQNIQPQKMTTARLASNTNTQSKNVINTQTAQKPAAQNKATNAYYNKIKRRILKFHKFPLDLRRKKQKGVVKISFTIDRNGNVIEKTIVQSSGYTELDAAALNTLTKANPFPPIPQAMRKKTINMIIPINYSLKY